jgi:hypothetical protein
MNIISHIIVLTKNEIIPIKMSKRIIREYANDILIISRNIKYYQ